MLIFLQPPPSHLHGVYDGLSCGPGQGASHEALLNVQCLLLPPDGPLDLRTENGCGTGYLGTLGLLPTQVLALHHSLPATGLASRGRAAGDRPLSPQALVFLIGIPKLNIPSPGPGLPVHKP